MKKSIANYMEPKPKRRNAQAMIPKDLHDQTSRNLKRAGYNWVKLIEAACRQFNSEQERCAGKKAS